MTKFIDSDDVGFKRVSSELFRWIRNLNKQAQGSIDTSNGIAAKKGQSSRLSASKDGETSERPKISIGPAYNRNVGLLVQGNDYQGDLQQTIQGTSYAYSKRGLGRDSKRSSSNN